MHPPLHGSATSLDLKGVDIVGFAAEVNQLQVDALRSLCWEDYLHLRKIELWGRFFTVLGYLTAWTIPNPLSALALSLGQNTRWLIAHHVLHKGYDKVPGIPSRYTSKKFAVGWRRFIDWFDWIEPRAWDYEHNQLHHYHTGEHADPDLLEDHVSFLRALRVPFVFKYTFLLIASLTWKLTYYAPNTCSVLNRDGKKRLRREHIAWITVRNIFQVRNKSVRALWTHCYLPYGVAHFVLLPALFLPLGKGVALCILINKLLAEAITNLHSFIVIAPNHTADDLHRFKFHYNSKEEFYLTQILASANYRTGADVRDFLSIWLNYQIEHHLFPALPMLKYRQLQPKVKELCRRYGIPYRQEPVFKRFVRMMNVCVGKTSLRAVENLQLDRPSFLMTIPTPLQETPVQETPVQDTYETKIFDVTSPAMRSTDYVSIDSNILDCRLSK